MDPLTASMMLLAGLLHAAWHALVKSGNSLPTLAGMGLVSATATAPFLFAVPRPPNDIWPVLCLSLLLHAGYKIGLAQAYGRSELSRAYPLARGFVPLFAAALSYAVLGQSPGVGQFAGIAVVSAGVVALILERASRIGSSGFFGVLGAGGMVAAYSVVDAAGTRSEAGWASFTAWLIVLDSLFFLGAARLIRGAVLWRELRIDGRRTLVAGALGVTSFAVFLWALSRQPVAAVVAFRECSVIFAALIGWLVLRERVSPWRLAAIAAVAAGLIIIAASR